jgi:hypothetical protein
LAVAHDKKSERMCEGQGWTTAKDCAVCGKRTMPGTG